MDYTKFETRIKDFGIKPNLLSKSVYVNLSDMISDNETINAITSCMGKSGAGGIAVTSDNFYSVVFNKTVSADKVVIPLSKISGCAVSGLAAMLNVSVGTLRNWEQGRRRPAGAALSLLKVVSADPKYVEKVLVIV